jgi:hypothetical protein
MRQTAYCVLPTAYCVWYAEAREGGTADGTLSRRMTSCPHGNANGNPISGQVEVPALWRRQHAYRLDTAQPGVPVVVVTISEVVEDAQALITLAPRQGPHPWDRAGGRGAWG